jgi:ribonuclease HI
MTDNILVHVDGLCEPRNPGGVATCGFYVERDGVVIHESSRFVIEGNLASNNVAEYAAVNDAMTWLLNNGMTSGITIQSDSQLVVNQMSGKWECHGGLYVDEYLVAKDTRRSFKQIRFEWIPRERNARADALTHKAYEEYCASRGKKALYRSSIQKESTISDGDTCMTCKWMKKSGPHVGCFPNGKYKKWISMVDARSKKCDQHEK